MSASVLSAWLAADSTARALLGPDLAILDERKRCVRAAAARRISPHLVSALREQNAALPPSEARRAQVEALAAGNTAAVVTGQQVGLFLGPLFTFYKAASAIVLARALEPETGVRCVPVFWVQNEDHDFVEINHCWLPGPIKVALPDDDERMSVAHRSLGTEVRQALTQLEAQLAELPEAQSFLPLVRDAYAEGRSLSSAFVQLLATCFREEGLVFLDPRTPAVAELTTPLLRRAVTDEVAITAALTARGRALAELGYAEQVAVRPGSPLCFYHLETEEGPRHRLDGRDDAYALIGGEGLVPRAEVLAAPPLRLSASALLRPLVQDALLPTAAYVGGPGELAYFAQLQPLYRHFEIAQPMFALRARLRLVDAHTRSLLDRAGLTAAEVEQPRDRALQRITTSPHPPVHALRDRLLGQLQRGLSELEEIAKVLDENLLRPIQRTRDSVEHGVDRLLERYGKARAEKDQVSSDRITRLQATLFPNDVPQERFFGLPYFAAKHGLAFLKTRILESIAPYATDIVDVSL